MNLPRHGDGDQVLVSVGGWKVPGWVKEDVGGRGYKISLRSKESPPEYFGNSKVKPLRKAPGKGLGRSSMKRTSALKQRAAVPRVPVKLALPDGPPVERGPLPMLAVTDPIGRAVVKPAEPDRSPAYRAYVRMFPCCNCGVPYHSDPHHEGAHGTGQKCSDYYCVPLCRRCHDVLTDTADHQLPDPLLSTVQGKIVMRGKRTSADIMEAAKDQYLRRALAALPRARQIEVLARALAAVPELPEVLKGQSP